MPSINIRNSSNWTFREINISGQILGRINLVSVSDSSNIHFQSVSVRSGLPGTSSRTLGPVNGLALKNVRGVTFINGSIKTVNKIGHIIDSQGVIIHGNDFVDAREGLQVLASSRVQISSNLMSDWQPRYDLGEHPDMIQVFSVARPVGSSCLTIRDNFLMAHAGGGVQGIFVRSEDAESGRSSSSVHSRIRVENNIYYGGALHGISLSSTLQTVIRGNTVVASPVAWQRLATRDMTGNRGTGYVPAIRFGTNTTGVIEGNIAPLISTPPGARGSVRSNYVFNSRNDTPDFNPAGIFSLVDGETVKLSSLTPRAGTPAAAFGARLSAVGEGAQMSNKQVTALQESAIRGEVAC